MADARRRRGGFDLQPEPPRKARAIQEDANMDHTRVTTIAGISLIGIVLLLPCASCVVSERASSGRTEALQADSNRRLVVDDRDSERP